MCFQAHEGLAFRRYIKPFLKPHTLLVDPTLLDPAGRNPKAFQPSTFFAAGAVLQEGPCA